MIARYAGAVLGLFAFSIVIVSGLLTQNPVGVTLSRSIFALFLFCLLGFVLGGAAQMVVNEHDKFRSDRIQRQYGRGDTKSAAGGSPPAPVGNGRT